MKKKKIKERNFVAKYDILVNKAKIFTDRKKALKRGYRKHKGVMINPLNFICFSFFASNLNKQPINDINFLLNLLRFLHF